MNFTNFAQQVKANFDSMSTRPLYRTNVDLDEIKQVYLSALSKQVMLFTNFTWNKQGTVTKLLRNSKEFNLSLTTGLLRKSDELLKKLNNYI